MSVAERYNTLLREYQELDRLDGALTADKPSGRIEVMHLVIYSVLNEVSDRMYLTEIAKLAREGKRLPLRPIRWSDSGYFFAGGLCYHGEDHLPEEAQAIYNTALPRLQALVCEARDAAQGAFERYKLAVEQGVAVTE